jgi:predicted ATPase
MTPCNCDHTHVARRIVLTGGPGAGKTATLELIRQAFCKHVHVLPEAATIVFGGGFPRERRLEVRRAAQRAIFHVQRELEATAAAHDCAIVLCDRGTVDGLAYWPGPDDMLHPLGTTLRDELARYDAVIHLRTPLEGYDTTSNPLRTESAAEAAAIDDRIAAIWSSHPRRFQIPAAPDFFAKVERALAIVRAELPACCHGGLRN